MEYIIWSTNYPCRPFNSKKGLTLGIQGLRTFVPYPVGTAAPSASRDGLHPNSAAELAYREVQRSQTDH